MAQLKNYNRVRNSFVTPGTGTLTVGAFVSGGESLTDNMASGDSAWFYVAKGAQWEVGLYTYTSPDQLARTSILASSNSDAAVDFAPGTGEIGQDIPASVLDLLNLTEITVTSAATFDIGTPWGTRIAASGTTGPVTSLGTVPNKLRIVRWAGATLTHNATSLILKGGANRVTVANDVGVYASDASGNWRELSYHPADGKPVVPTYAIAAQSDQEAASSLVTIVTPGRQQFHPSALKYWALFNAAVSIGASYNTTSVTDTATGDWTVNIAVDFSSGFFGNNVSSGISAINIMMQSQTGAGTLRTICVNAAGSLVDPSEYISSVGYGDQ